MNETLKEKAPIIRALGGEIAPDPPVWLMRQAGRYLPEYRSLRAQAGDFLNLCLTPRLACAATLQPLARFDLDAAIIFSDILLILKALGRPLTYSDHHGPGLPPLSPGEIEAFTSTGEEGWDHRALEPVYEAIALTSARLPSTQPLIGFAGAPLTLFCYLVDGQGGDFARARSWIYERPDCVDRLIALITRVVVHHLKAQVKAGCRVLQLFESWAEGWPVAALKRWSLAPLAEICAHLQREAPGREITKGGITEGGTTGGETTGGEATGVPVIIFARGAGALLPEYAAISGIAALGLDTMAPLDWAHATLAPDLPLQGNLDPRALVVGGDGLERAVVAIRDQLCGRPLIFNLGHGVRKDTPLEHVADLLRFLGKN